MTPEDDPTTTARAGRATLETLERVQALLLDHLVRILTSDKPPSAAMLAIAVKVLANNADAFAADNLAKRRALEQAYRRSGANLPFYVPEGEG